MNGLLSPNLKVWKEPRVFLEFDLNEYSVLVALLVNGRDQMNAHFEECVSLRYRAAAHIEGE